MTEKIVLAYSGGLDTSVACRWLQDDRGYEVHCLTVDLGQAEDGLHDLILRGGGPARADGAAGGLQRLADELGDHGPLAAAQRAEALVGQEAVDGGEGAVGVVGGHGETVRQFYHIPTPLLDRQWARP